MTIALQEAAKASLLLETPIGCIIVHNNKIIGRGHNLRNTKKSVLYHAELIAISEACKYINDWRLEDCTIFVTLEPCQMCAGAIVQARIPQLVYGAKSPKSGCAHSILAILNNDKFNHKVDIIAGIQEEACSKILRDFFRNLRKS